MLSSNFFVMDYCEKKIVFCNKTVSMWSWDLGSNSFESTNANSG